MKRSMYNDIVIKFVIDRYRKYKKSNFNPTINKYWSDMYESMFKKW